ncbi:hydrolase [Bacillaceae bacterium Marseille-Q3522]|nr:hydrolase [Bacillaceae bacterium Marseille-Q3522]
MEIRSFQLDTEWNMIHYPEKPQGFGILIIGDERHFVEKKNSYWTQNKGKLNLLRKWQSEGYTIFYSNLYQKNWGSDKAVYMAKRLYDHIVRHEIINNKIHLIAEGMGALVAIKLIRAMKGQIRSVLFLNPIFSLKNYLEQMKEETFFHKKLRKEISRSYEIEEQEVEKHIKDYSEPSLPNPHPPLCIIHLLADKRAYKQAAYSQKLVNMWNAKQKNISVFLLLPEKKHAIDTKSISFFKENEQYL